MARALTPGDDLDRPAAVHVTAPSTSSQESLACVVVYNATTSPCVPSTPQLSLSQTYWLAVDRESGDAAL